MNGRILGGRYELIENIGEGGMAIVYKARDNKLNRLVAVKVLKKEFADNEDIAQKFKREATAIAKLSDPNIVNVLDVGHEEENNIDYFVMEYVNGKTLKDIIIYNGKLGYSTAIDIAIQVAKALECAHKNNIIHRDVKPQNILVTENGDVKVTDFGIAKSSTASTITNTTTIMGSAHYLSPEQAKGTFIDLRSDMYSLGIVLYEMVTGRLPFEGESPVTIALKHIQEEPKAPKDINSSIPESINQLINKAISKDPIKRYQNSRELILDLQKIKENPDVNLGTVNNFDDSRTIIMTPIKSVEKEVKEKVEVTTNNDFYDEDESNEEEKKEVIINNKKKNNKLNKSLIIIAIIASIFLIGGGVFALSSLGKSEEIIVPNIVGMNVEDAKKQLESMGLSLEVIDTKNSAKEKDTILESNPKANEVVKKGTAIKVIISSGVEKVKVPDLRDYEVNYIMQILDQLGLKYSILEEYSSSIEAGYFISQYPERGVEVDKGSEVKVTISKGPEIKTINIENYRGLTIDEAKKKLENANIPYEIIEKENDRESENGIVLNQSRDGLQIDDGSKITLEVGKYVKPKIDVTKYINVGMLLGDAINSLKAQGIDYSITGGNPQEQEFNLYTIKNFTPEIISGEKVQLEIEKIPEETPDDSSAGSASDQAQDTTNQAQDTAQAGN
jgi:serine/threonine-protein kinase